MVKSKKPNPDNQWIRVSLGVIIILVMWFYFFQGSDKGFDFDEEKYIRGSLSDDGYNVIDTKLEGTTIYAELSCPSAFVTLCDPSLSSESTWLLRVNMIMNTLATPYEVEPYEYDILEMSKKELESLGIDYDEIQYMSDEELEEVSEIIAQRASNYVVKIHFPLKTCSYRLTRDTYRDYTKASEICLNCDLTNSLYAKMNSEIKNSETCY